MNIETRFLSITDFRVFPNSQNLIEVYQGYKSELTKWVHNSVNEGAAMNDGSFLTNHGNSHIATLIERASKLLNVEKGLELDRNDSEFGLSPFELFLLLLSMHIHDAGNISGREKHEEKVKEIIDRLGAGVANQHELTWVYIFDIAKAHKGEIIDELPAEDYLHERKIRPQLLAAILKFSDELAENCFRADKLNLELNNIPEENLLFHIYADSLNSVVPESKLRTIHMRYFIKEKYLKEEYFIDKGKNKRIYLLDYVYKRTIKTNAERIYCMKFLRPLINIDVIKVTINIMLANGQKRQKGFEFYERIPRVHSTEEFVSMFPELLDWTGIKIKDKINSHAL